MTTGYFNNLGMPYFMRHFSKTVNTSIGKLKTRKLQRMRFSLAKHYTLVPLRDCSRLSNLHSTFPVGEVFIYLTCKNKVWSF